MNRKSAVIQTAIEQNIIDSNLSVIGVMDFDGIEQTVFDVYHAFPENFQHTFAVKANPLVSVLSHLKKAGMGAEVASSGELMLALAAGFDVEKIIYDSPTKTYQDLRNCIEKGISINIDNVQELARLDLLMEEFPDSTSIIGFRINPQVGSGNISSTSTATATSKFGYALRDNDNHQTIIDIYQKRPWLKSIHTHTGSQGCSLELMARGVSIITTLAEEINTAIGSQQILRIDIGGGLPVNFSSDEITPTFKEYAAVLATEVPLLSTTKYQVKTEFGRAIVAKNGFIISRIEYSKFSGKRHIVATQVGAQIATRTTFLPESWPLRVTGYTPLGEEIMDSEQDNVMTDVSGPCCFAGDLIVTNQSLPQFSQDDYLVVHDTGGYYFSNHFDYNCLPRVAVYSATDEDSQLTLKCIRKAETLEEIVSKMSAPKS